MKWFPILPCSWPRAQFFSLPLFHLFFCPLVLNLFHSYLLLSVQNLACALLRESSSIRLCFDINAIQIYKVARSRLFCVALFLCLLKMGCFPSSSFSHTSHLPPPISGTLRWSISSPSHFSQYAVASAYSSDCYMLILVPAATYPVFGPHDALPMGRCE